METLETFRFFPMISLYLVFLKDSGQGVGFRRAWIEGLNLTQSHKLKVLGWGYLSKIRFEGTLMNGRKRPFRLPKENNVYIFIKLKK